MTRPYISVMLAREGKMRHLASKTDVGPFVSLCGALMDERRTNWHLLHKERIAYPDCKHCAASVIFKRSVHFWMDMASTQSPQEQEDRS